MGKIIGIIVFVLNILATVNLLKSGKDMGKKILWIALIWLLPGIGLILYYVIGNK